MSVIRQPGMLGRTTRRRLVGMTAALTATALETLAVGFWLWLVLETRSTTTALAGLGILFIGSLLRTSVFGFAVSEYGDVPRPQRLAAALVLTTGWILWLYVAELLGGVEGIAFGTAILGCLLTLQLVLERRAFRPQAPISSARSMLALLLPAALLAIGGATLLASIWLIDWTVVSPPLSFEVTTIVLQIDAVQLGVIGFAFFAFLAHQRRFQSVIDP